MLDRSADLTQQPASVEEDLFVNFLILHVNSTHRAMREGMYVKPEGLQKDLRFFFSLPIPQAVWRTVRPFHDKDFVRFVEENLHEDQPGV